MEQINKIEILGTVGNVRITEVGARRCARVSVAVASRTISHDGSAVMENTWFNCLLWGPSDIPDCFDYIRRGARIHIIGRIRTHTYTDITGREMTAWEVVSLPGFYWLPDEESVTPAPQKA